MMEEEEENFLSPTTPRLFNCGNHRAVRPQSHSLLLSLEREVEVAMSHQKEVIIPQPKKLVCSCVCVCSEEQFASPMPQSPVTFCARRR